MGMEDVLAAHVIVDRTSRYSGAVWCTCGFHTEFTGRVYDEYRAHVAEALAAAGFGNLHDAWAEGRESLKNDLAGTPRYGTPGYYETPNPYPKVSET